MVRKVLVVEDSDYYSERWLREIGAISSEVELIIASDINEATILFATNTDIAAIVMDACVPGNWPNTYGITQEMRNAFEGPMIACSSDPEYRAILMQSGCNYQASKDNLIPKLLEILGNL